MRCMRCGKDAPPFAQTCARCAAPLPGVGRDPKADEAQGSSVLTSAQATQRRAVAASPVARHAVGAAVPSANESEGQRVLATRVIAVDAEHQRATELLQLDQLAAAARRPPQPRDRAAERVAGTAVEGVLVGAELVTWVRGLYQRLERGERIAWWSLGAALLAALAPWDHAAERGGALLSGVETSYGALCALLATLGMASIGIGQRWLRRPAPLRLLQEAISAGALLAAVLALRRATAATLHWTAGVVLVAAAAALLALLALLLRLPGRSAR